MLRRGDVPKEEDAVTGWSMEAVGCAVTVSVRFLRDVWPSLKPGGLLVYSTCTLNTLEDEENVAWIAEELGAEILPLDVEPGWGVVGNLLPLSSVKDTVKAERLFSRRPFHSRFYSWRRLLFGRFTKKW